MESRQKCAIIAKYFSNRSQIYMNDKKLYSFDIFDTVLVRTWATTTDLFWQLGSDLHRQNLVSISEQRWLKLRVKSEQKARRNSSTGEVTLQEIYSYLCPKLNWSQSDAHIAMSREIELELNSLHPVLETASLIRNLHQAGEGVVYISDMYLDRDTIKLFLQKNNLWQDTDKLYVSSEIGLNKSSGKLFTYCLDRESLNSDSLIHTGDNIISDVEIPLSLGIKSVHFDKTQLNRYEKQVYKSTNLPLSLRSLIAGTSRLTRLQCQESTRDREIIWNTTSSVTAPVLFGFVYWCIKTSQQLGIKKLYFVSRDGQILLKIANIICKNWGYDDIECRYLYGSRQAWHFPAIQKIGENEIDWLFDPTSFLSVRSVCDRVNLNPSQIANHLIAQGFTESCWDRNLDRAERNSLKQVFSNIDVEKLILSIANQYREDTLAYFKQEGITDGEKFALVDIGWNGRLQRSFSNLLASSSLYPEGGVHGFYFGLSKRLKAFPSDRLLTYFCDVDNLLQKDVDIHKSLLEVFVAADHGGTIKYQQSEGRYQPVLRSERNDSAIDWGLTVQQTAVESFATILTENIDVSECQVEHFIEISAKILKQMTIFPSSDEAKVFGSFKTTEDQNDSIDYELSPVLGIRDFWLLLISNKKPNNSTWLSASFARSNTLSDFQIFVLQYFVYLRSILAAYQRKILFMFKK
jgi:predicted HAD superfamily hydrolase